MWQQQCDSSPNTLHLPCTPAVCPAVCPAACSEGILWHVLTTPLKISVSLLARYSEAVGDVYCPEKKKGVPVGSEIVTEAGAKQAFKMPPKDARESQEGQEGGRRTTMVPEPCVSIAPAVTFQPLSVSQSVRAHTRPAQPST